MYIETEGRRRGSDTVQASYRAFNSAAYDRPDRRTEWTSETRKESDPTNLMLTSGSAAAAK